MRLIGLRFGTPVHGWLDVELSGPERDSVICASDVPGDSLSMLACAACALVEGHPAGTVTWFLEPTELTWTLRLVGDEIRVMESIDGVNSKTIAAGSPADVALTIWRALRRLEADPAWARVDSERVWSHPFPHEETAQLGYKLGRG
jgi:hypothetical protein